MEDIIVVGGGASGLMAAIAAAEKGAQVVVLEKNTECGKKILATGNGRCNFTNSRMKMSCFHSDDLKRTMNIIDQFNNAELVSFFESVGIVSVAKEGWYYPRSMSAESVQKALVSRARKLGVKLKGGKTVTDIRRADDHFDICVGDYVYQAARVILSAGGLAAPKSGSTGDGISVLQRSGINIVKPLPALVPLIIHDNPLKKAAGVRCDAEVTLVINRVLTESAKGNLQITEYGISGIPVFQISSEAVRAINDGNDVEVMIDFLPEYDGEETVEIIEKTMNQVRENLKPSDPAYYLLNGIFPEKLARIFIEENRTIEEWNDKLPELKYYPVKVTGSKGFNYAQTTSGGVTFDELNEDLSVKKIPGLYICGELVDVDGICGGYNLQWAFSSGHLAGTSAAI